MQTNYKILLDNGETNNVSEDVLFKIPELKKMIDSQKIDPKVVDKTTLDLRSINAAIFSQVCGMVKHNATSSEEESKVYNNDAISKMDVDMLMDFTIVTKHFGLDKLTTLATTRFMTVFRANNAEGIRKTFNIANNFSEQEMQNIKVDNAWKEEPK